jgi:hypothetical protein
MILLRSTCSHGPSAENPPGGCQIQISTVSDELTLVLILPADGGGWTATASSPSLLPPHSRAAGLATIQLAAIAVRTNRKQGIAGGIVAPAYTKGLQGWLVFVTSDGTF